MTDKTNPAEKGQVLGKGKVGYVIGLYQNIARKEKKLEQHREELQAFVNDLNEEEMKEYVEFTEKEVE